jgi:hypothetical protein
MTRTALKVYMAASESDLGTYTGTSNGKSTTTSGESEESVHGT